MKCRCGAWCDVKETRERGDGTMRRRYVCANGHRFSTLEAWFDYVKGGSGDDERVKKIIDLGGKDD